MTKQDAGSRAGVRRLGLVALLVGTAFAVATGCGGKEEATPGAEGGRSAPGGGAPGTGAPATGASVTEHAAVDPANEAAYRAWLKANEVEAPEVSLSGTRGVGGADAGWPLLPRGDVRLEGLSVWRFEVDQMSFEPQAGGVLEFRKGKDVLWRDTTAFTPASRIVQGGVPKSVLDAVKLGDTVTWGIVYDKEPKRSLLTEFKVVNKPSAAKQIDRLENDRQNARQALKVKSLGRNQVLLNNSLFAEALRGYMDLAVGEPTDPIVQEACYRIVECLRRLRLDDSLLYSDAVALAANKKAKAKSGVDPLAGGGGGPGAGLAVAGEYQPTGTPPPLEPTPPPPVAPPPPPPGTDRRPTDPATRRAVEAVEAQATALQKRFAEAEARVRQQGDAVAQAQVQVAALTKALEEAKGTDAEAEARKALLLAEATLQQAKEQALRAEAGQTAAGHDKSMLERLRELMLAPPLPHVPDNPEASWKAMAERAQRADAEADARGAKARQLDTLADAAEAAGKSDAAEQRAAADAAALAAATARLKADELQLEVERAFLALPPTGPKAPPGPGPSHADRVAVLTGWVARLNDEASALEAVALEKAKAAQDAEAAGDPNAATLLAEAKDALEASQLAAQRAHAALEALEALRSLEPKLPGG